MAIDKWICTTAVLGIGICTSSCDSLSFTPPVEHAQPFGQVVKIASIEAQIPGGGGHVAPVLLDRPPHEPPLEILNLDIEGTVRDLRAVSIDRRVIRGKSHRHQITAQMGGMDDDRLAPLQFGGGLLTCG
jgi:hypothetical protein